MTSRSIRAEIWRERVADGWANAWRWVLMAFGAAVVTYLLLDRGVQNGAMLAVVIAALVVAAALSGSTPLAIALVAVPGLLIPQRIGLGGGDLSVSDAALAAAFGTAPPSSSAAYSRPLRSLLILNLVYQFATLFTVIVNPYVANTAEWLHAWLLVSGALIVGWGARRRGLCATRPVDDRHHGVRHRGSHDRRGSPADRCRELRTRYTDMAVPDA